MPRKAAAFATEPPGRVGNFIHKQREAMHMTVAQLAVRVGVSRNTITNYEAGKTEPGVSELVRLSAALGCTIQELLYAETAAAPPRFAFRAHAPLRKDPSIAVAARKYVRAYDEIEEITHSRLQVTLRKFGGDYGRPLRNREIEMAADTLRRASGIHYTGPENIAGTLESLGVRTLFFEHPTKGLDAISAVQGDMVLVMLRDRKRVVERTIFSAAHELGHLALHPHLFTNEEQQADGESKRYEDEANRFAGNFLVPSDELVRIWKEERLDRLCLFNALILLKRVFHVSFHCLYFRVTELRLHPPIDRAIFTNQIKQHLGIVGRAKIDDLEPDPLDPQVLYRTTRFSRLVRSAFIQELIGVSKVAEIFQVTVERAQEIATDWLRPKHELVGDGPV